MRKVFLPLFIIIIFSGCNQDYGPGYQFDLFKSTKNWELAKAVEKENAQQIQSIIGEDNSVNVNLQESLYGNTLLHLAIGNDKLLSTKILLQNGADLNIADSFGLFPLHEAASLIGSRKNSAEIIKLLLDHGANPNKIAFVNKSNSSEYLPLMAAVQNLECTKLLLEHGANLYYKDSLGYPLWSSIFLLDGNNSESIYVAKYLIIDKKMTVPNPVFYTVPNHLPRDIYFLLEKFNTHEDAEKQKLKTYY
jgi:hypothetical protein